MADLEIYNEATSSYVDITQFLAPEGLTITRTDKAVSFDTMDGKTHRSRIAAKRQISCTCRALKEAEVQSLFGILYPESFTVRLNDPQYGTLIITAMCQSLPAVFRKRTYAGEVWWSGISFTLEEL